MSQLSNRKSQFIIGVVKCWTPEDGRPEKWNKEGRMDYLRGFTFVFELEQGNSLRGVRITFTRDTENPRTVGIVEGDIPPNTWTVDSADCYFNPSAEQLADVYKACKANDVPIHAEQY